MQEAVGRAEHSLAFGIWPSSLRRAPVSSVTGFLQPGPVGVAANDGVRDVLPCAIADAPAATRAPIAQADCGARSEACERVRSVGALASVGTCGGWRTRERRRVAKTSQCSAAPGPAHVHRRTRRLAQPIVARGALPSPSSHAAPCPAHVRRPARRLATVVPRRLALPSPCSSSRLASQYPRGIGGLGCDFG